MGWKADEDDDKHQSEKIMTNTPQTADPKSNPLGLRVLPLAQVIPHERTDPERVSRLIERLTQDNLLKNPPIVMAWQDQYVVLDGATRVEALTELAFPHIVAQVVSRHDEGIGLSTWNHVKQGLESDDLLALIEGVPGVQLQPVELAAAENDRIGDGICHLILPDRKAFLVQSAPAANPFEVLNQLVRAYIDSGQVYRIRDTNFDTVLSTYPDLAGFFVFPHFSVEQVLEIARTGDVVPAGITRFVIPGRVLRMNVDLDWLRGPEALQTKQGTLDQQIQRLMIERRVRYYEEPLYLLDE
jgi:hypothetical protein